MLRRKLLRELRLQKWQVLAVVFVILSGVALFDASYLAYQNLRDSYRDTQERSHLADMTLDVVNVTPEQLEQIADVSGIAEADSRTVVDLPMTVPNGIKPNQEPGKVKVEARFISIPLNQQPKLDQVILQAGSYPDEAREVVVDNRFAEHHGLELGDELLVDTADGPTSLTVSGIGVSAEYLWVSKSRQDIMPSPGEFGVFYIPREGMRELGYGDSTNQVLYELVPEADSDSILGEVKQILHEENVLTATPQEELIGVQLLQMDLDSFKGMALTFPFIFLIVAGFVLVALLSRMVDQQAPQIGTLMALGVPRTRIMGHYLQFSLIMGIAGALLGSIFGVLMGMEMTKMYARELNIPYVSTTIYWSVALFGAGFGLLTALLAGYIPARRAARMQPAQAMKPYNPANVAKVRYKHGWLKRAPLWLRLPLRDLSRHRARTLGTALGVAAALVLVLSVSASFDSIVRGVELAFTDAQRYDFRVDYFTMPTSTELTQEVEDFPGIQQTETMLTIPVQVRALDGQQTYDTVLQGVGENPELLKTVNNQGEELKPVRDGAILTQSVAAKIGVGVGDQIEVKVLPDGTTAHFRIGGLSDTLMGNSLVVAESEAQEKLDLEGKSNTLLVTADALHHQEVREQLQAMDGVVSVTDLAAQRGEMEKYLGLGYLMLGFMLVFGVVLAGGILFNTATLSILERQRELATMRAMGMRMSSIVWLTTVENGLIALLGLIIGFPLAMFTAWQLLHSYSSDFFSLPFYVYPRTVFVALLGVLLVLIFAQWPALRRVAHMDLAEATKLRE